MTWHPTPMMAVAVAVALLVALTAAASASPPGGVHVVRMGHGKHGDLYKEHHAFMSPFFRAFVHNQKKGFPFPGGKECEEDAHRVCGGILRRCVGRFGCSMQCMTDHAPELSDKCRKAHPCFVDIDKFCPHVEGGRNAMMNCLHGHLKELTPECKAHHPCLTPGQHHCHALDYNTPPVEFVDNVAKFLDKVRSGAFLHNAHVPVSAHHHGFFHPGGFSANRHQHSLLDFKRRLHHARAMARRKHHGHHGKGQDFVEHEMKHVEAEERELLNERRELDRERRELQHEREQFARERGPPHHSKHHPHHHKHAADATHLTPLAVAGIVALAAVGGLAAWKWHTGRSGGAGGVSMYSSARGPDSHAL